MAEPSFNAYEMAQRQFDGVAEQLGLDRAARELLRRPLREYHFTIPIRMDDGTVEVFQGFRVQHNDARGPARAGFVFTRRRPSTPCARWPPG